MRIPSNHAHLNARVTRSTVTIAVTVEHLDDDPPTAGDVAAAIRDGLHSDFFDGAWPTHGWTIEKIADTKE